MAYLSPASKKAIAHLRAFTAPPTNWYKCPVNRRAAVLILLFADRKGDLRVVLTIRSSGLRNYAGQAALPGGKSDTLQETPWLTARREAFEEIGLPMSDQNLPTGYTVEHLTELPTHLAMTELGVRPCVAFLKTPSPSATNREPDAARDLLPKLDAKEVAAMFTAPFENFLKIQDLDAEHRQTVPGEWYRGSWHSWHATAWRMHQFFVPVSPSTAFLANAGREPRRRRKEPKSEEKRAPETTDAQMPGAGRGGNGAAPSSPNEATYKRQSTLQPPLPKSFYATENDTLRQPRYRVFGMTARILVDAARVAYGVEPEFEHNNHFGDEDMIAKLIKFGRLSPIKKEGDTLTRDVMQEAARVKI